MRTWAQFEYSVTSRPGTKISCDQIQLTRLSNYLRFITFVVYSFLQFKSVRRSNQSDLIEEDFHALHLPVSVRRLSICIAKLGRINLKRILIFISRILE
jgi:hypothetical protein